MNLLSEKSATENTGYGPNVGNELSENKLSRKTGSR